MRLVHKIMLVIDMRGKFSFFSCIKILFYAVLRKYVRKAGKDKIIRVFVKKLSHNVWIRPFCTDYTLLFDFFVKESHEKGGHYEFPQIEGNISWILDAGGNIGFFALLYASKYPNAKIITVEPECANFKVLKLNCADYKNIIPINGGIWSQNTGLKIENPEYHSVGFKVTERDRENGFKNLQGWKKNLQGYSVLYLMDKYKISEFDIVKMDIEGSEFNVILNDNSREWLGKVRYLIMEIHDVYMKNGRKRIYEHMSDNGFSVSVFGEDNFFERKPMPLLK